MTGNATPLEIIRSFLGSRNQDNSTSQTHIKKKNQQSLAFAMLVFVLVNILGHGGDGLVSVTSKFLRCLEAEGVNMSYELFMRGMCLPASLCPSP